MIKIVRSRTIRPSTRLVTSKTYKVDTEKVGVEDLLEVNIKHESNCFCKVYHFNGQDIASRKSIHFKVIESRDNIEIVWSGIQPNQ